MRMVSSIARKRGKPGWRQKSFKEYARDVTKAAKATWKRPRTRRK
jgi:hypothetical protein